MRSAENVPVTRAREAFLWACGLDVTVRKPGNVSVDAPGHGMVAQQFIASAQAAADALFAPGRRLGERVEAAVSATHEAVACNTNLGIVLLCAPLGLAAERECCADAAALQQAVEQVLDTLDIEDARAAYRAIARAHPAGLGHVAEQDVAAAPTIDLRTAMALAADRDLIARQYANGFADVFAFGLPTLCRELSNEDLALSAVVQRLYVRVLARYPDSHICRKYDMATAEDVRAEATRWCARLEANPAAGGGQAFSEWDESLKRRGLNPGTTADMTVTCLFAAALLEPRLSTIRRA